MKILKNLFLSLLVVPFFSLLVHADPVQNLPPAPGKPPSGKIVERAAGKAPEVRQKLEAHESPEAEVEGPPEFPPYP